MTLANGIYFDLPFEDYEKIERLSKSGIKRLLISPADYWAESPLNPTPTTLTPEQERRQKIARLLGKAYHCARLEPAAFHDRFVREISQADFAGVEGFLSSGKEMGEKLEQLGLKKSGSVMEQALRLRDEAGYSTDLIWQLQVETWENDRGDRLSLPAEAFDQIIIDMGRMAAVPQVHDALSNGFAEVSILYDCPDTGLPMKSRLDWLRADGWAEFKSFANSSGKPVDRCIMDAIRFNLYYVDLACYHEAVELIRIGELQIVGEHSEAQAAMIEAIGQAPVPLPSRIIFQQKHGVPNVLSRDVKLFEDRLEPVKELQADGATEDRIERAERFAKMATTQPTMLMMKARAEIRNAKRLFMGYSEIYPRGEPWLPFEPHQDITDADFHPNWLEDRS